MKKTVLFGFIAMVLLQLFVPAQMIWNRENVLKKGVDYKFRAAPVDPNDPFRGKYVILNFAANEVKVPIGSVWDYKEDVFVSLTTDTLGYAKIKAISKTPFETGDYIKVTVQNTYSGNGKITIRYPFDRFYLDEFKAKATEKEYREALRKKNADVYAVVAVKDGEAVLKDLVIK